jgi:hypothetical protein
LLFAFDAIRGAVTRSNVKVTSGALPPAPEARPSRTTVSPERTLLTFADPVAGRMLIIFYINYLFIGDRIAFGWGCFGNNASQGKSAWILHRAAIFDLCFILRWKLAS